jgi:predicted nucleic acid-binding protein
MKILLDTNILVHAYNKSSPNQKQASKIIKQAIKGEIDAYLTSQVLYEFFAVVTDHRRVENPMSVDEAADLCLDLWDCREIEKVNPTQLTPSEVFKLAKNKKLAKGRIFDCIIAVTAKENKIDVIYTENVRDFENYGFVKVLNPFRLER